MRRHSKDAHAERCGNPVHRVATGKYWHRGFNVIRNNLGDWSIRDAQDKGNSYNTLADALNGADTYASYNPHPAPEPSPHAP